MPPKRKREETPNRVFNFPNSQSTTPVKKQKKGGRRGAEGKKEAKNVTATYLTTVARNINKNAIPSSSKRSRVSKSSMIGTDDISALYNLYSLMLIQRKNIIGTYHR